MTLVSRRKYDHPTLATAGGTGLHASIENLYTLIGNDSMSRYAAFSAIANSTVGVVAHEFGLDFANLKVQIFTGTYPALTLVADPIGSGWTVAATSGLASRSIDVTTPASGGPHTFSVLVSHESLGTQYIPGLVGIGTQSFAGAKTFLTSTSTPISAVTNYSLYSEVSAPATPLSGVAIYAKTDKKMYRKGTDGVEAEIGSGSASGFINYILNADLEAGNTTGWATYKDAAAATPVDGTGGSPTTLTVTANGTTPLRGNFDLKIAKTAANSQGEGFSYDFTIKSPDISKKLQVSFDLNTSDANYASSDVVIYLYDVTNSTLITPSVTAIPKIGASTYSLTFDTTTSLSYRLIFHWATTNATASNIFFENFFVGPGSLVQGAAVSPWVSSLFTVSTTTNATTVSYFQRVGSSMNVIVKTTYSGASNAGTGHNITLPAGYTIDTTVSPLLTTIGTAQFYDDDLSTYTQGIVLSVSSTVVRARWSDDTAAGVQHINSTASTPFTIAANDVWSFQFTIPIAEWAAQGTANLGINPIQYLGNSNTSTSVSDTSAFTFGPAGNSIVAVSSTGVWVKKRVQLLQGNWSASGGTPIVKVSADGLLWLNAQDVFPPLKSAGLFYGIDIQVSGVNTVDVAFGGDGASTGAAWSTVTSYKWRVDVAVPGQAVGFGIADTNASGLIPSGVYNNTTQAWTFGGSGSTQTQIIYGNVLDVVSAAGASGVIKLSRGTSGTTYGRIGHAVSANNLILGGTINDMCIIANSGIAFTADDGTRQHGRLSTAGAWMFGPDTGDNLTTTHIFKSGDASSGGAGSRSVTILRADCVAGSPSTAALIVGNGTSQAGIIHERGSPSHIWTRDTLNFTYTSSATIQNPISGMTGYLNLGSVSPAGTWTWGDSAASSTNGIFHTANAWKLLVLNTQTSSASLGANLVLQPENSASFAFIVSSKGTAQTGALVVGGVGTGTAAAAMTTNGSVRLEFGTNSTYAGEITTSQYWIFGSANKVVAGASTAPSTGDVPMIGNKASQTVVVAANSTMTFQVSALSASQAAMIIIMNETTNGFAQFLVAPSNSSFVVGQIGTEYQSTTAGNGSSKSSITYANASSTCTLKNGFAASSTYRIFVMSTGV